MVSCIVKRGVIQRGIERDSCIPRMIESVVWRRFCRGAWIWTYARRRCPLKRCHCMLVWSATVMAQPNLTISIIACM